MARPARRSPFRSTATAPSSPTRPSPSPSPIPTGGATIGDGSGAPRRSPTTMPPPVVSIADAAWSRATTASPTSSSPSPRPRCRSTRSPSITTRRTAARSRTATISASAARSASPPARPARRSASRSSATTSPRPTRPSPSPCPTRPAPRSATAPPPARSPTTTARGYYSLAGGSFTQNWTNTGQITADDNWSRRALHHRLSRRRPHQRHRHRPAHDHRPTQRRRSTSIANQTNPDTFTTGGVAEFDSIANPVVGLQGSGTADAPYLVALHGRDRPLRHPRPGQSARPRRQRRQRRPADRRPVPDQPDRPLDQRARRLFRRRRPPPASATQVTAVDVILPAGANNAATLEIRIMTTNAVGNDEWVGIDDIVVSSAVSARRACRSPMPRSSRAMPAATAITFTVTRDGRQPRCGHRRLDRHLRRRHLQRQCRRFRDRPARLPARSASPTARPRRRSRSTSTAISAPRADENFTVTLSNAVGGTIGDGVATGTIVNDDGPPPLVTINDVTVTEGDSGTSLMTFTVTRTGGTGAFDVDWETADGTRHRGRATMSPPAAPLSFAAGEMTDTVTVAITINGDTDPELGETLPGPALQRHQCRADRRRAPASARSPATIRSSSTTSRARPISARSSPAEGITSFNVASRRRRHVRAVVTAVDNVGTRQGLLPQRGDHRLGRQQLHLRGHLRDDPQRCRRRHRGFRASASATSSSSPPR